MASWCLPPKYANAFVEALKSGDLAPDKLTAMSSAERREAFSKYVGEENASEVNAQFESKLLLADQKRGLVHWAKKVGGISEPARRDILTQIGKLDRVLQPADEQAFLEDLAAKKLGISVTSEEAQNIFNLSQKAQQVLDEVTGEKGTPAYGDAYRAGWTQEKGEVYGAAQTNLLDYMNSLKPSHETFAKGMFKVLNVPRELETGLFHWSAPFVQLWGMISNKVWYEGVYNQFQYFRSEGAYQKLQNYILGHPDYPLARDGKLGLTGLSDKLTAGEEGLQAHLLMDLNQWLKDKSGGIAPNALRSWNRSFVGVINYVRFERFTELLQAARMNGEDVSLGSKTVSDMAKVVNNFTGRGTEINLGVKTVKIDPGQATALNVAFYAPRKFIASIEMFNPITIAKLSPTARVAHIRQLVGAVLATGSIITLAKMSGAHVDLDPRSSDFAKIVVGGQEVSTPQPDGTVHTNTVGGVKFDITGGNAAYLRFLARMISNQSVTASGKVLDLDGGNGGHGMTRAEVFTNFARGKLAPVGSTIADALYNQSPGLQPGFSVTKEAENRLIPIAINSWLQMALNDPKDTAAYIPALTAFLGVGMESPLPPVSENGRNVWGEKLDALGHSTEGEVPNWYDDPINKEAELLNYRPSLPSRAIRGQKLTDDQYDQYVQLTGRLAHTRLEQIVTAPNWEQVPTGVRLKIMKGAMETSRRIAGTSIMMQSQGSTNDILAKANAAKSAALGVTQ